MSVKELEAEALKLSPDERAELVRRLLARMDEVGEDEDPLFGLGSDPVACGVRDGASEHDRHLYGPTA